MRVRVLGSGSCELKADRSSSAYVVETETSLILLDCGQGTWRRFVECGFRPQDLSGVLISHHHMDHLADVFPLFFGLHYDPVLREHADIALCADTRVMHIFEELRGVLGDWLAVVPEHLAFSALSPGQGVRLGDVEVRAARAVHLDSSLAFRLEGGGRSIVYLGDSLPAPSLAEMARGADLLICHTVGSEEQPHSHHMHGAAAGQLAAEAGVSTLLLSHFYRAQDVGQTRAAAAAHFAGSIVVAEDHVLLEPEESRPGYRVVTGAQCGVE